MHGLQSAGVHTSLALCLLQNTETKTVFTLHFHVRENPQKNANRRHAQAEKGPQRPLTHILRRALRAGLLPNLNPNPNPMPRPKILGFLVKTRLM